MDNPNIHNTSGDPSLNAFRHGAASERLFVGDEKPADFEALLDDLFAQYHPANTQAASFVFDFARARWVLDRRQRIHDGFEACLCAEAPESWPIEDINKLNLFDRYLTQAQLRLRRAYANLQSLQKEAFNEEKWRQQLALQKQKLALEIQRCELQKAKHAQQAQQHAEDEASKQHAAQMSSDVQAAQESLKPLQNDPELGPVLVQHGFISVQDGETVIDEIIPSHSLIRQYIDNRAQYQDPPTKVVRYFAFANNIPPEYEFLIEAGAQRTCEERRYLRVNMDFQSYSQLADLEEDLQTEP